MSSVTRTLGNLRKIGIKNYLIQLWYIGDTKAGTLVGTDKFGNKYYENAEELPLRTRWVDYAKHDYDASQVEPQWHFWLSQGVDTPPSKDATLPPARSWAPEQHNPNYTGTRGAFKTYSTTKSKVSSWEPVAAERK